MPPSILPYMVKDHRILKLGGEWDSGHRSQLETEVRNCFKISNKVAVEFSDDLEISHDCIDSIIGVFRDNMRTKGAKMGLVSVSADIKNYLDSNYNFLPFPDYVTIDSYKRQFRLA